MRKVIIYSDGACEPNPGKGGYGTIIVDVDTGKELVTSGAYNITTNNRMELMGILVGLELLKYPCEVKVVTDSKYAAGCINGWMYRWNSRNKWSGKKNSDILRSIWRKMQVHKVTAEWVKGHNGHEYNERCDYLAVAALLQDGLEDVNYCP